MNILFKQQFFSVGLRHVEGTRLLVGEDLRQFSFFLGEIRIFMRILFCIYFLRISAIREGASGMEGLP